MTAEKLVEDDESIVCWTCGSATTRTQISEMVEQLQEIHEDLYGEREQLQQQIEQKKQQKASIEETKERQATLEESVADIESQLSEHRDALHDLRQKKQGLAEGVSELESDLTSLRQDREDAVLELHQDLNTLERDLHEATEKRESVQEEIDAIQSEIDDIGTIEDQVTELDEQITDLRGRVERIERDVIDSFNGHIETVLGVLEYENIERIWIERREVDAKNGRRKIKEPQFDLHVIRESDEGSAYEDSVTHLSESEREVTGLVFALAGYLVHNVYETVPFMILDSLEAIDSDRIALLLDYLRDYADNIVVALLEGDASGLPDEYHRVTK